MNSDSDFDFALCHEFSFFNNNSINNNNNNNNDDSLHDPYYGQYLYCG